MNKNVCMATRSKMDTFTPITKAGERPARNAEIAGVADDPEIRKSRSRQHNEKKSARPGDDGRRTTMGALHFLMDGRRRAMSATCVVRRVARTVLAT